MKASELLNQLQALIAQHGDCELDAGIDDMRLQGVDFLAGLTGGVWKRYGIMQLDFACEEVCCVHCGKACAEEIETGKDRYGSTWEYRWPEACPGCGKNPQE